MRVLGIDPASAGITGYGVIESEGRRCRMLKFGGLPPNGKLTAEARLREVHAMVTQLIERYAPEAVAVESVFSALNVKTALKLAEVRGVVLLAAAQADIPVHSYSPREVKLAVTGYGHAEKSQIQQMVRAELRLDEVPRPADAADALAVALCHVHCAAAGARAAAATGGKVTSISMGRKRASSRSTRFRAARIQTLR
jgi:crossover junction endodeoxyribonuclease RuvC